MSGPVYIKDFEVVLRGNTDIQPAQKLTEAELNPMLVKKVNKAFGHDVLTSIQKFSIPAVMSGYDVVGLSQTGTGKTGAYLIPIINRLLKDYKQPDENKIMPEVLVLAPTRELAVQIQEEAEKLYARNTAILTGTVYGGIRADIQRRSMEKGVHILVATPGRMHSLIWNASKHNDKDNDVNFSKLHTVVVDEADHIPDTDFKGIVDDLLRHETISKDVKIQTLFFSATTSPRLEAWRDEMMRPYEWAQIEVGKIECPNDLVQQEFLEVRQLEKNNKMVEILKENNLQTLIFVRTRDKAFVIMNELQKAGITAEQICSNLHQRARETFLQQFKEKKFQCLVATDVCCRGLHIDKLEHVLNYDMPNHGRYSQPSELIRAYVHRIGRTGRMFQRGLATSFFDPGQDHMLGPELFFMLESQGMQIPPVIQSYERVARLQPLQKKMTANRKPRRPRKKKAKAADVANLTNGVAALAL